MDIVTKLRDGFQFHYIDRKHGEKIYFDNRLHERPWIMGGKLKNRFIEADLDTRSDGCLNKLNEASRAI